MCVYIYTYIHTYTFDLVNPTKNRPFADAKPTDLVIFAQPFSGSGCGMPTTTRPSCAAPWGRDLAAPRAAARAGGISIHQSAINIIGYLGYQVLRLPNVIWDTFDDI